MEEAGSIDLLNINEQSICEMAYDTQVSSM